MLRIDGRHTGVAAALGAAALFGAGTPLAKLKAGIAQHCPQILDPNNDKAVEQLLQ